MLIGTIGTALFAATLPSKLLLEIAPEVQAVINDVSLIKRRKLDCQLLRDRQEDIGACRRGSVLVPRRHCERATLTASASWPGFGAHASVQKA